jgi:hypothetical protein
VCASPTRFVEGISIYKRVVAIFIG